MFNFINKFINKKIVEKDLMRRIQWFLQRRKYGFDDRETWDLFNTIGKFTLPRLKRFRKVVYCHPSNLTMEEWQKALDDMIFAINYAVNCDDLDTKYTTKELARLKRGFKLFGTYFMDLWS